MENLVVGLMSVGLVAYLLFSILRPEKFHSVFRGTLTGYEY